MKRFLQPSIAVLIAGLMLVSCKFLDQLQPKPTNPGNPIKRVAVLPLQNDTTEVDAPNFVRKKLAEALAGKQYNVKPISEVDRLLRNKLGVTLGGQLKGVKPSKLRKALDVEGVVMGTLMDFDETTIGIYNVRKVRGKFRMINCINGKTFWKNGIGIKSQDHTGDLAGKATAIAADIKDSGDEEVPWETIDDDTTEYGAGENLVMNLGKQLFSKATDSHLENETDEMIRRVTSNLPPGPGTSVALEQPAIPMPSFKMPTVPYMAYMDDAPRYFSAVLNTTTINKKDRKQTITSAMPLAKSSEKFRLDMDLAKMSAQAQLPPAFQKMTLIHRGDRKKAYNLYPNQKRYVVFEESEEPYSDVPEIKKTRVGKETIDGHPTIKYKVKIIPKDGPAYEGYIWNATDLKNMTIKSWTENEDFQTTTLLTRISLKKPADRKFAIPSGYSEAANMMELYMAQPQQ